jgi:hypothetical protein
MLTRAGLPLALAELRLKDGVELVDLDDPRVLLRERLRPSEVATRSRTITQGYAVRLFDRHREAIGLRWWSTLEARLENVTLYDRAAPHMSVGRVTPLALTDAPVREAAELLGLSVTRPGSAPPPEPLRPARRRRRA